MMDRRLQEEPSADTELDLPPESAAAHLEAIAKGINDIDVIVQGLLDRTPPLKPWQRRLRAQLQDADRHVEILRLAISLEHDGAEIYEAARQMKQTLEVINVQIVGAILAAGAVVFSGLIADRLGRTRTLAALAAGIAMFSGFAPTLLGAGELGQDVFVLVGFVLLGLSYGQAAGSVTANFGPKFRYTGAALTSDLAWLIGAAFAPLIVLGLCARFGLAIVGVYLLSGAICTLVALGTNYYLKLQN